MNDTGLLANLLGAATLAVADVQDSVVAEGLHPNEVGALNAVSVDPGIDIQSIAGVLRLTHSACVRLVQRLEGKQLIRRSPRKDRRQVGVRLTSSGKRRIQRIHEARIAVLTELLRSISRSDQQALFRILPTILSELTRSRAAANHICRFCDETVCRPDRCPVEIRAKALETQSP